MSGGSDLPSVSVVVPTYQRRDGVQRVVRAALADPHAAEVLVVVDGSTDGTAERLGELARDEPRLRVLVTTNHGAGAARQHGVDHARGEVVLLLDDDVVPGPGLAAGHARHHAGADDLVVVGHMPPRVPARRHGAFTTRLYAEEYEAVCTAYERDPTQVLRRLWGGNVSLRRERLRQVPVGAAGFSHLYHEDQEFGLRCARAGLRGRFDRSLSAVHEHHRPLRAWVRDARRMGAGRVAVHAEHGDLLGPLPPDTDDGLPGPARALLAADRWRPAGALVRAVALTTVRAAGLLRVRAVETAAGRLLRRLEQRRGARDAVVALQGRTG